MVKITYTKLTRNRLHKNLLHGEVPTDFIYKIFFRTMDIHFMFLTFRKTGRSLLSGRKQKRV